MTTAVNLVKASLEAVAATPGVKRFVLTSSSAAAVSSGDTALNGNIDIGADSYNTAAVDKVWAGQSNGSLVYSASKVQQEQAAWKFVGDRKPGFVFNTVLPDFVCGKILDEGKQGCPSSMGILKALWNAKSAEDLIPLPAQWMIDVEDNAMLHVAALFHPDAQGERIFGFAHKKNLTNTIQILRELYPDRSFIDPPENEAEDRTNPLGRPRAETLLNWVKGSGWTSYKDSLRKACDAWI